MTGLLALVFQDVTDGYAEVRETFKWPGGDMVAGLYVLDGRITRNSRTRVLRSGTVVHEGPVKSLKRFKDDVREVAAGYSVRPGSGRLQRSPGRRSGGFFPPRRGSSGLA